MALWLTLNIALY